MKHPVTLDKGGFLEKKIANKKSRNIVISFLDKI